MCFGTNGASPHLSKDSENLLTDVPQMTKDLDYHVAEVRFRDLPDGPPGVPFERPIWAFFKSAFRFAGGEILARHRSSCFALGSLGRGGYPHGRRRAVCHSALKSAP